jgi:hypothetical protein
MWKEVVLTQFKALQSVSVDTLTEITKILVIRTSVQKDIWSRDLQNTSQPCLQLGHDIRNAVFPYTIPLEYSSWVITYDGANRLPVR